MGRRRTMNIDYKAIGVRVKGKRVQKAISQYELANIIGVSNPHISNIERGKTKVSLPTLIDIANALETTLDELVCDNVSQTKDIFIKEIADEMETCSTEEIRIVTDVVKALIKSLKMRRKLPNDKNCCV